MKKRWMLCWIAAAAALLLTGCGRQVGNAVSDAASQVGKTVSQAGEAGSRMGSQLESAVQGGDTSQGTVDSGTDGTIGDEDGASGRGPEDSAPSQSGEAMPSSGPEETDSSQRE